MLMTTSAGAPCASICHPPGRCPSAPPVAWTRRACPHQRGWPAITALCCISNHLDGEPPVKIETVQHARLMLTGINQLAPAAASWHYCMLRMRRLLHSRLALSWPVALHLVEPMCVFKQPQLCVLLSLCNCAHSTAHSTVQLYEDQRPRCCNVSLADRTGTSFLLRFKWPR